MAHVPRLAVPAQSGRALPMRAYGIQMEEKSLQAVRWRLGVGNQLRCPKRQRVFAHSPGIAARLQPPADAAQAGSPDRPQPAYRRRRKKPRGPALPYRALALVLHARATPV